MVKNKRDEAAEITASSLCFEVPYTCGALWHPWCRFYFSKSCHVLNLLHVPSILDCLRLLLRELTVVQVGIEALLRHQLLMVTLFNHVTMIHDQNQISTPDGG